MDRSDGGGKWGDTAGQTSAREGRADQLGTVGAEGASGGGQAQGTHLLCRLQGEHGSGWAGCATASGPIYTLAQPLGGGVRGAGSWLCPPRKSPPGGGRAGGWADCTSLVTWWAGQPWGPSGFGDPHGWRVGG